MSNEVTEAVPSEDVSFVQSDEGAVLSGNESANYSAVAEPEITDENWFIETLPPAQRAQIKSEG